MLGLTDYRGGLISGDNVLHSDPSVSFTAAQSSRMYSDFSAEQMKWLTEENLTFNYHRRGFTLENFISTPALNDFYTVLSTSRDRNGSEFVSSMEGENGYSDLWVQPLEY